MRRDVNDFKEPKGAMLAEIEILHSNKCEGKGAYEDLLPPFEQIVEIMQELQPTKLLCVDSTQTNEHGTPFTQLNYTIRSSHCWRYSSPSGASSSATLSFSAGDLLFNLIMPYQLVVCPNVHTQKTRVNSIPSFFSTFMGKTEWLYDETAAKTATTIKATE
ncbi:uncharacterized protein EAE97_001163 [Botrytis byssoidea]|uniref:Uncharacterized protein n=1 Tax=Botrytis byssoidea TaxID=139641 RepID=A0A9P5IX23_9HELO|nr:uncharacterized protein EAE97_001163 [Botrytis byssoidea]KAF7953764.1 hypothetical protein EAE97_001163 [Botrytis byssoidea]